jgi:gamma-glutamyltranspeptidase/glutathione hydrolase
LPDATAATSESHYGLVAADDPQAALIGRDILSAGGSAADAAVAMYFTMAVTLPSKAGLAGGGVCLAFSPADRRTEALDFLPRAPALVPADAERPSAVPGNPRGFYALQARYGRLRWAELLAPAEALARFGHPVSRGLAADIRPVELPLGSDPVLRQVFARPGASALVGEGDRLVQLDLAGVIARLRTEGPNEFYAGPFATEFAEAARRAGGSLEPGDLAEFRPVWRVPVVVTEQDMAAHFPPPPPEAGAIASQIWAFLGEDNRYAEAPEDQRDHLLAEATRRAFAEADAKGGAGAQDLVSRERAERVMSGYRPERTSVAGAADSALRLANPTAASLVAVDASGAAVACTVTMNALFGTGRMVEGTGLILAAAPGAGGRGATMLSPMLVTDENGRSFSFAAAASGGLAAPPALIGVAARTLILEEPLADAIARPRLVSVPEGSRVVIETRMRQAGMEALRRRGHTPAIAASLGQVIAVGCADGLPDSSPDCAGAADPRGHGLALTNP